MKQIFRSLTLAMMSLVTGSAFAGDWSVPAPQLSEFDPSDTFYVYNVGQNAFLTYGECWGTQAIVSQSVAPLQFAFASQTNGGYQVSDSWNNKDPWRFLFRCRTDSKGGTNFRGMFVDNDGARAKNIYNIEAISGLTNIYKWSMVDYEDGTNGSDNYVETEEYALLKDSLGEGAFCVGVQLDHYCAYAQDEANGLNGVTHGIYYDVVYAGNEANCQWGFVGIHSGQYEIYQAKAALIEIMNNAEAKSVSTAEAEAVLNNTSATLDQVNAAKTALVNAVAATVTPESPEDYSSFISENDFESSSHAAWTSTCIASNDNEKIQNNVIATNRCTDEAANVEGAFAGHFWENWDPSAFSGKMYQTVKGLPTGVYKAELAAFVNTFDENNAINKTQYVFFNDKKVMLTTNLNRNYTQVVFVNADTLSLGLAQDSAIANWMGIDNAKLTFYGTGLVSYQYLSTQLGDNIEADLQKISEEYRVTPSYMEAFNAAVDEAAATTTIDAAIAAYGKAQAAYDAVIQNAEAWLKLSILHEDVENACYSDQPLALDDLLAEIENLLGETSLTTEEILAKYESAAATLDAAKKSGYKAGEDVTSIFVTNPYFNDATSTSEGTTKSTQGWTVESGTIGGDKNVAEAWNTSFNIYQDLTGMQGGAYKVEIQGFYRSNNGNSGDAWTNWTNANGEDTGDNKVETYLYAGNSQVAFKNIFSWSGQEAAGSSTDWTTNGDGAYLPNGVGSAAEAFNAAPERYLNSVTALAVGGKLRIGMKNEESPNHYQWSLWNDFKITYLGNDADVVTPVLNELISKAQALANENMYSEDKNALTNAVAQGQEAVQKKNGQAMVEAYEALGAAIDSCQASIDAYATLATNLATLSTALENKKETAKEEAVTSAESLISEINAGMTNGSYTVEQTTEKAKEIDAAVKALNWPKGTATDDTPQDFTFMIVNPTYSDSNNGWSEKAITTAAGQSNNSHNVSSQIYEMWNCSGEVYQDITGLPQGTYKVSMQGFFRDETSDNAAASTAADTLDIRGYIFTGTGADFSCVDSAKVQNIIWVSEDAKAAEGTGWKEYVDSTDVNNKITYFFPNSRDHARLRFDINETTYLNEVYCYVAEDGNLRIGMFNHNVKVNDWLVATNWKLTYYGTNSQYANGTGISNVNNANTVSREFFTIDGRKVNTLSKGLNIVRYKDANGKTVVKKVIVK